jgi:2-phospho-L-lactate guanylyltransferase
MPTIVVPYRGPGGKQRLAPLRDPARARVAAAMLADVLAACTQVGRTLLVAPADADVSAEDVERVADPGSGQGAAVEAALALADGSVLVVNADLPCVTVDDLEALLGALPEGGIAFVEAADGTTNALALAAPALFRPLYGSGSAARFRALGNAVTAPIGNLVDDVDTLDDLRRRDPRLGPNTRRALASLELRAGEAA